MFIGSEQKYHPEYSFIEKTYIALFGIPIVGLRIRLRNLFSLIPKDRAFRNILDAGSGSGVFTFELGRRFSNGKVVGIDYNDEAISASNHIAKRISADNVSFVKVPIEEYNENNKYDLIICIDILEHIDDDLSAIKSLFRLMAHGGILVLHVPSLYRRYPLWQKKINFNVPTHVRPGYTKDELKEKIGKSGFILKNIGYTYGFWETVANNVSYMITKANMDNKVLYSLAFPILNVISMLGAKARPKKLGAGTFVVAEKPDPKSE